MRLKELILKIGLLLSLTILPFMLINYLIDPYQFYRQPKLYEAFYFDNQRFQNPGLARNYDYDNVIVGTSMTENFIPENVSNTLGNGEYIKLAISGSSAKEQNLILNVALEHQRVNTVIWGLDYGALQGDSQRVENEQFQFPEYLYDDNPLNDIKYLVSKNTLSDSLKIISGKKDSKMTTDLSALNVWGNQFIYGEEQVKASFSNMMAATIQWKDYGQTNLIKSFEENILPIIEAHEEVTFIFYLPPYSIYHWKVFKENGVLEDFLGFKEYLIEVTKEFDHVSLYDFQDIEEIICHLGYYKDTAHHSPEVNDIILESIKNKAYLLTEENVVIRNRGLKTLITAYFE